MGFFQRLKEGLKKTSQNISNVFKQTKKIDEDFYDNIEETLIESDMGFETTEKVIVIILVILLIQIILGL